MRAWLFAALVAWAGPAGAQAPRAFPCAYGPRDAAVAMLAGQHHESQRAIGLSGTDRMMEIWVNGETGTWTLLFAYPDGMSCIVATGQFWQDFSAPFAAEPLRGAHPA